MLARIVISKLNTFSLGDDFFRWLLTLLIFVCLFLAQAISQNWQNTWLLYVVGSIATFWPAWLLATTIFGNGQLLDRLIILPVAMIILGIGFLRFYSGNLEFASAYTYYFSISAFLLVFKLFTRNSIIPPKGRRKEKINWDILLAILAAYSVLALGLAFYYPFLRQVDSYYFKDIIDTAIITKQYPALIPYYIVPINEQYETGLQSILITWSLFSSINTFIIFRFGTVLLAWYILPLFGIITRLTQNRLTIWLALSATLTLSAIFFEVIGLRPQGLVLSLSLAYLYFLVRLQTTDRFSETIQYLVAALFSIIAIKFTHVVFILLLPLLPLSLTIRFWSTIIAQPIKSFLYLCGGLIAVYPYIIIFKINYLVKGFIDLYFTNKINFVHLLDSPFSLTTYLANFALFLPIVSILGIVLLLKFRFPIVNPRLYTIPAIFGGIFFTFMEIMPRLGVVLAPERSFLYVGLALVILSVPVLDWLSSFNKVIILRILMTLLVISISMAFYQLFLPQYHIVSRGEVDSFRHVIAKYNPPPLVITPAANYPIVAGYTDGLLVPIDQIMMGRIFMTDQDQEAANLIAKYRDFNQYLFNGIKGGKQQFEQVLQILVDDPNSTNLNQLALSEASALHNLKDFASALVTNQQRNIGNYQTLIIYPHTKDQSFLSRFGWFKDKALLDAHLEKFNNSVLFKPVFDNEFISAWEVK